MAGLLYFAKGFRQPVTLELAKQWGLGYAFEESVAKCEARHPEHGDGQLFADIKRLNGEPLAIDASRQEWTLLAPQDPSRPELYVAYWSDNRPAPEEMSRRRMLPGHDVELGDGQVWSVPFALQWTPDLSSRDCVLERRVRFDPIEQAWVCGDVEQRYAGLWKIAVRFAEWQAIEIRNLLEAIEGDGEKLDSSDELELTLTTNTALNDAATVLAVNYILGPVEASHLGLVANQSTAGKILDAVVDGPTLERLTKKKRVAAPGTGRP